MKKLLLLAMFLLPLSVQAVDTPIKNIQTPFKIVKSPVNRVALLELYTSEGCSSCPPADRFLSALKTAGISDKQLIPVAFHVTY